MTKSLALVLGVYGLVGCTGPAQPPMRSGTQHATAPMSEPDPEPAPTPTPSTATPPSPADGLTITNLRPGVFELVADRKLAVKSAARIERRGDDGVWVAIANLDVDKGYRLIQRCEDTPPACVEMAPGKPLRPMPLTGMTCSSQCNHSCRANGWLGPAVLRLAVDTCDGQSLAGPAFELPDDRHVGAMPRWSLTRDAASATIVRMHDPDASKDRVPGGDKRLLWRAKGKERALDPAQLEKLLALVGSADGYDDQIAKRCLMDHLVGFRLVRRPASTGAVREETLEIVIDFGCAKFFAGSGGGTEIEQGSHFDPSRAAWLAFVREVLPDDRELAKLK